jgi:acetyl-CoA acetyltransferase
LVPDAAQAEGRHGFSPPVFYALCAHRYLHETGAPREALASVAVHNRRLGSDNPAARYREPITVEEVLSSRMIAEPLTLLQCCPPADGAGALLVAAADAISGSPPPGAVRILGLGAASRDPDETSLTSFREDVDSGRAAYEAAGVGPRDIDVAEVHDAFTISQVIHLEDLGIAAPGEGWRHAVVGESRRPVVNPSGGLLSRGHPLGATGIAQFDSIRRYLSTPNGDRRDERRLGLVQQAGGLRALGQILSEVAVLGRLGA